MMALRKICFLDGNEAVAESRRDVAEGVCHAARLD